MKEKINYKGYTIEAETDLWASKYTGPIRYYNSDERIYGASSIEDAKQQIDDRTLCQEPRWLGKLDQLIAPAIYIIFILCLSLLSSCSNESDEPKFDCEKAYRELEMAKNHFNSVVKSDPRAKVLTPVQSAVDEYHERVAVAKQAYVDATRVVSLNCK